jgi:hypothetical protein
VEHDSRFFMYLMLVVDFMHDWELGVWKALLIHLIRLVTAQSVAAVQTLDFRCALPMQQESPTDCFLDFATYPHSVGTPFASSVQMYQA